MVEWRRILTLTQALGMAWVIRPGNGDRKSVQPTQMLCYRQLGSVAGLGSTNDAFRTSRHRWSHRSGIVLAASILRKQNPGGEPGANPFCDLLGAP